jgi:hypothetical protein
VQSARTNFIPQDDGLKFVNRFEIPNFLKLNLPIFRSSPLPLTDIVYGLCGGMVFTALDYFNAGRTVPPFTNISDINLTLFYYLWHRQLDSLGHAAVEKIFSWMLANDPTVVQNVINSEAPALRSSLDSGKPAPLVLIRVQGLTVPTHNHQVLAVGYDFDPLTNQMTVYLYDPNHPGEEPSLALDLSQPAQVSSFSQSTGEPLRGFFVIQYSPQTPP